MNRSGRFNVPYGEYSRPYYNRDTLLRASKSLASAEVRHADYSAALTEAEPGDWVYLDPPYIPDRVWGDFKRYTADQFPEDEHQRLADLMRESDGRGVFLMLTNSDTKTARRTFKDFRMRRLATRRDIHLNSAERDSTDLVFTNY